jgi:plastocyanin
MKKWLAPFCACIVLGLVAAGCGGDDDDSCGDSGSATTTEQTSTTEKTGGAAAKTAAVDIVDIDFEPKEVTVPKGATITWTNTGNLPHTVTKDGGPGEDFDSGSLSPGDTFKLTVSKAGKIDYLCTIHSGQTGSITVQ